MAQTKSGDGSEVKNGGGSFCGVSEALNHLRIPGLGENGRHLCHPSLDTKRNEDATQAQSYDQILVQSLSGASNGEGVADIACFCVTKR